MKLIIEVTEDYYEFIKNSTLKSVSDITILDGIPYDDKIEEVIDLLETEWGYEGIREDIERIMRGGRE